MQFENFNQKDFLSIRSILQNAKDPNASPIWFDIMMMLLLRKEVVGNFRKSDLALFFTRTKSYFSTSEFHERP